MASDNPYAPPTTDVTPQTPSTPPLAKPPFESRSLVVGGWLALLAVPISVPVIAVSFDPELLPTAASTALSLINIALIVYLMVLLVRYMRYRYGADDLDTLLKAFVVMSIAVGLLGLAATVENSQEFSMLSILSLVTLPFYGIPFAMFGFRLRKHGEHSTALNTLAWLTMISGVMLATIVLALLSIPLGFAWDIALAVLFLNGAREIRAAGYP